MEPVGRLMMWMGGFLFVLGLAFTYGGRLLSLGRLPGDIVVQRGNFTFYFPLMTSILLSVILSLLFWIVGRLR
ncbi:DUF2905 domain-containing protein [Caldinitratiruptor microaerophilus]|uniref:DUF2905 domain-containing protein n=1 Tax=Caldinitratiruptor microaerophilus TaxID=671077 RepID=A0AA35CNW0_9FIRM|nr:DUF2905 domain-containing protein [Caldinitratiruptor microaerophilus]BDG60805.1 hypothetical protein caldi_18950 [Caldinitratiruptor microaerophilus]